MTLALDRMQAIKASSIPFRANTNYDLSNFYQDVIGVTVSETLRPQIIHLFVYHSNAPYVLTKPLHPSQTLIEKRDKGIVISINVQINFELEREILGFGDSMIVIQPQVLKDRVWSKLRRANKHYEE